MPVRVKGSMHPGKGPDASCYETLVRASGPADTRRQSKPRFDPQAVSLDDAERLYHMRRRSILKLTAQVGGIKLHKTSTAGHKLFAVFFVDKIKVDNNLASLCNRTGFNEATTGVQGARSDWFLDS